MIKGLITAPAIEWEEKGKDAVVLANYMRLLFFSNNENPVKIGATGGGLDRVWATEAVGGVFWEVGGGI